MSPASRSTVEFSQGTSVASAGLRNLTIGQAPLGEAEQLLHEVFPASPKFQNRGFLDWFYEGNPDGRAIWRNAIIESEVKAHYGSIPQIYHSKSGQARVFLSVDSATGEALRGRGAFVALGEEVYAAQRDMHPDVAAVIGVPNRQAAPPRAKKLGWTLIETLPLRFSLGLPIGRNRQACSALAAEAVLDPEILPDAMFAPRSGWRQQWSREKLHWRASNPLETIWLHRLGPVAAFVTVRRRGGISLIAVVLKTFAMPDAKPVSLAQLAAHIRGFHQVPAVAYIGRNSDVQFRGIELPERWRPSPLILGGRIIQNTSFRLDEIDCFEAWDYDVF